LGLAEPLLLVRTPVSPADVIVVLGGDGTRRGNWAAKLYRERVAPRILVTGDGDCIEIRDLLESAGVPPPAIMVECKSGNTWENASFSGPLLLALGVRRAVLVTSWWHTRRALACFQRAVPQVQWMSAPVERVMSIWQLAQDDDGVKIAEEYLKIGWYAWRHNFVPPLVEIVPHRVAAVQSRSRAL
jgi:uncharacterized SAM-binding protein YcdF (DUF218 family)